MNPRALAIGLFLGMVGSGQILQAQVENAAAPSEAAQSTAGSSTTAPAKAELRVIADTKEAWTGQRLVFQIEIRAPGSFDGATVFDLPEVPQTAILKVGNPVIGSDTSDGSEYFTQTHAFSLFSQVTGSLTVPPITARFAHRKGYTGPSFDAALETEPLSFTIKRPPGSESLGFLVTTEDITISEAWTPTPAPAEAGAVFTRTIEQRSAGLTGMTLAPAPRETPEGVRLYEPKVEVNDDTQRGAFTGSRTETLTYLFEAAGTFTLPEMTFNWWDPKAEKLESHTLPAQTFEISPAPGTDEASSAVRSEEARWELLVGGVVAALLLAALYWQRARVTRCFLHLKARLFPEERKAAQALLRACRKNDPEEGYHTWLAWRRLSWAGSSPELETAARQLMRIRFGREASQAESWKGDALATAVKASRHRRKMSEADQHALPPLNPS